MSDQAYANVQAQQKSLIGASPESGLLQRTCACGQHTIAGAECSTCRSEQSLAHRTQRPFAPPSAPLAVQGNSPAQGNATSLNSTSGSVSRFGHDFSRIPVYSSHSPVLQTKLTVNRPGDIFEQEADQAAEQVMRMAHPVASANDDEEQAKNSLMRKQSNGTGADAATGSPDVPPAVHTVLSSGGGQPLDMATRAFMEPRFGHDFSKVRVHTDGQAAESARAINAFAYTVGRHIVFAENQYAPGGTAGQHLLAHELTHVVQQGQQPAARGTVQRLGFFEKIGVFLGLTEGNFDDKELKAYLDKVTTSGKIEDKYDSDNKARAIVRKWKAGSAMFELLGRQKLLLIKEMDKGYVGKGDQNEILDLLERCDNGDLRIIFGSGGMNAQSLSDDFGGSERRRLEAFYASRFKGGKDALLKGSVEPVGASSKAAPKFPYNWNSLQAKLAGPYTAAEIVNDLNALSSAERDQALQDVGKERIKQKRLLTETEDKSDAEKDPVKKKKLEDQGRAIAQAVRKMDVILQPVFKDIAIAETPASLAASTRIPTAAEKVEIGKALKPDLRTGVGGVALPFEDKLVGETKNYEDKLRDYTPTMITDYYNAMVVGKGKTEHDDPTKVHPLSEFERIGNESKKETDKVFGSYKIGPTLKADVPAIGVTPARRGNIHDLWQDTEEQLKSLTKTQKKQMAKALMFYFFQSDEGVLALNRQHNADPKFTPPPANAPVNNEAKMQDRVADVATATDAGVKRLNEIDRGWDASAGGGEVNIQIFKKDTPDKDRDFLWDMFQTLIHEYLHTLVHANYETYAKSFGEGSSQFNTLIEGVDSLLDEIVWANVQPRVNDPALRAQVEGPTYSALPPIKVLPASRRRYASYDQAIKLVTIVGIRNLYIAYFLGDVDKIKV